MGLARGVTRSTLRASLSRVIGSDGGASGGEPSIPTYAIVDRDGEPIVDRDGNFIIADPTPRTS
jgi:hypothetical protein